jgi:hypothetical protein
MKKILAFLPPLALCAAASAQITAIGPFVGSDSETFEASPGGVNACVPGRVFNNKGDLCDSASNGMIVSSGWSFVCQIAPHAGTHFVGDAAGYAIYTLDNPVSKFGGYFGTNSGYADASVSFYDSSGALIGSVTAVYPADCNWYWNGWQANAGAVIKRIDIQGLNPYGGGFVHMDDMQIEAGCTGNSTVYCTGKVNSAGCTPSIGSTGIPSATAGSGFVVSTKNELDNKFGLYFYSKAGANNAPFQGGYLCGQPPLTRTSVQNSGGTPPCNGMYSIDFNAYIASGKDPALVGGQQVWLQTWSRDPASPSTTNLSDALSFTICP